MVFDRSGKLPAPPNKNIPRRCDCTENFLEDFDDVRYPVTSPHRIHPNARVPGSGIPVPSYKSAGMVSYDRRSGEIRCCLVEDHVGTTAMANVEPPRTPNHRTSGGVCRKVGISSIPPSSSFFNRSNQSSSSSTKPDISSNNPFTATRRFFSFRGSVNNNVPGISNNNDNSNNNTDQTTYRNLDKPSFITVNDNIHSNLIASNNSNNDNSRRTLPTVHPTPALSHIPQPTVHALDNKNKSKKIMTWSIKKPLVLFSSPSTRAKKLPTTPEATPGSSHPQPTSKYGPRTTFFSPTPKGTLTSRDSALTSPVDDLYGGNVDRKPALRTYDYKPSIGSKFKSPPREALTQGPTLTCIPAPKILNDFKGRNYYGPKGSSGPSTTTTNRSSLLYHEQSSQHVNGSGGNPPAYTDIYPQADIQAPLKCELHRPPLREERRTPFTPDLRKRALLSDILLNLPPPPPSPPPSPPPPTSRDQVESEESDDWFEDQRSRQGSQCNQSDICHHSFLQMGSPHTSSGGRCERRRPSELRGLEPKQLLLSKSPTKDCSRNLPSPVPIIPILLRSTSVRIKSPPGKSPTPCGANRRKDWARDEDVACVTTNGSSSSGYAMTAASLVDSGVSSCSPPSTLDAGVDTRELEQFSLPPNVNGLENRQNPESFPNPFSMGFGKGGKSEQAIDVPRVIGQNGTNGYKMSQIMEMLQRQDELLRRACEEKEKLIKSYEVQIEELKLSVKMDKLKGQDQHTLNQIHDTEKLKGNLNINLNFLSSLLYTIFDQLAPAFQNYLG